MMMRTVSLAAAALIGALAGFTSAPVAGASGAQSAACDELGGDVQSGNICSVRDDTPLYIIHIRFGTDYPDDQPVADYLIQNRDDVVNAAQAPGAQHLPYEMTVSSTSYRSGQPTRTIPEYGQPWHGTESLVLANFQSTNGALTGTKYKAFNFDYDQNRPVTFDNLFAPGTNPIDSIYPAVAEEMARQQTARNYHLPPSIGRDPATYQNFAITDDTVIFFFDTGQLMTPEAGYFFAPISRASLPPLQL